VERTLFVSFILRIILDVAPMYGLVITEANSLLDRPLMYIDGELKDNEKIIPVKMDQIYLKFSTPKQ